MVARPALRDAARQSDAAERACTRCACSSTVASSRERGAERNRRPPAPRKSPCGSLRVHLRPGPSQLHARKSAASEQNQPTTASSRCETSDFGLANRPAVRQNVTVDSPRLSTNVPTNAAVQDFSALSGFVHPRNRPRLICFENPHPKSRHGPSWLRFPYRPA
jgi:hypothetical protein